MTTAKELMKELNEAFAHRAAGEYSAALQAFERLERKSGHPSDIAALRFFQAVCLTDLGRPEDARIRLSKVDRSQLPFAEKVGYEFERARIERALDHPEESLAIVSEALKMTGPAKEDNDTRTRRRGLRALQGILLTELERCDEAIPILQTVRMEDPGWAEAQISLGDCRYREERYREAIECYHRVASTAKKVHQIFREAALRNIGFAHHTLGEYAQAVEYLEQIQSAYDEIPGMKAEILSMLASAHSELGNEREAKEYQVLLRRANNSIH
jgi:tetratricopeptide (TPR) repeat protein